VGTSSRRVKAIERRGLRRLRAAARSGSCASGGSATGPGGGVAQPAGLPFGLTSDAALAILGGAPSGSAAPTDRQAVLAEQASSAEEAERARASRDGPPPISASSDDGSGGGGGDGALPYLLAALALLAVLAVVALMSRRRPDATAGQGWISERDERRRR
jgi:hypothetical protein